MELTRQLPATLAPELQPQIGSRIGVLMILAAVYLGTVEGRPMNTTKLASFVGMPRGTVIRWLRLLCRRGAIVRFDHVYRMPAARLDRIARRDLGAMVRTVRSTADKLKR
ncbi:hypothetical protein A6X20_06860 [Bradyrhizobium elkanii]|nr:hypothetical protein A6X20_06860 [Bradyrhizobium elkanii]ODM79029.1 hypothetical protein A6452_28445 [Bradyrhizobium elkanii]